MKNYLARLEKQTVCPNDNSIKDSEPAKSPGNPVPPISENTSEELEDFLRRVYKTVTRRASFSP